MRTLDPEQKHPILKKNIGSCSGSLGPAAGADFEVGVGFYCDEVLQEVFQNVFQEAFQDVFQEVFQMVFHEICQKVFQDVLQKVFQ